MLKRILTIMTVLLVCLTLLPLPAAASSRSIAAVYAEGVVAVSGAGFTSGVSYTVRVVDRAQSIIKAMGQTTADGSGGIVAYITIGNPGVLSNYEVYVNNPDGTCAGTVKQITLLYTATIKAGIGGTIQVGNNGTPTDILIGSYAAGEIIKLQANANSGYKFKGWLSNNGTFTDADNASTTFKMPSGNTVITANFVRISTGSTDKDERDRKRKPKKPAILDDTTGGSTDGQSNVVAVDAGAIDVSHSDNASSITVRADAIAAAAQMSLQQAASVDNGTAIIGLNSQIPANISEVVIALPGSAVTHLAQNRVALQISLGFVSIRLSPEVLGSLPNGENVRLTIRRADPEKELDELPVGMNPVEKGVELDFGLGGGNTGGSIIIDISIESDADRDLIGLYHYNESTGELAFIGGRIVDGMLRGVTGHNSKYFVLEYHKQFDDTKANSWYSRYVDSMAAKHVLSGYPDNTFRGMANMTRGEFAVALANVLGLKNTSYKGVFDDIKDSDYYAGALQSLYEAGIMKGIGDNSFMPKEGITREEIFAIIGRISGANADIKQIQSYEDLEELSEWAADGAAKAVVDRIIIGEGNRLNPKAKLSRYEAAAILYRLFNK